jgi:TatD DNase family protein
MYNFLVDTHTHLYAENFDKDRDAVMQSAIKQNNVQYFYLPNVDLDSVERMHAVEAEYSKHCQAMMGLHPCSVDANYLETLENIGAYLGQRDYCAIGEIGLDYYWDLEWVEAQKVAFLAQCDWAKALDIPIAIHARNSNKMGVPNCIDDLIALVETSQAEGGHLRGVFHCFVGTLAQAEKIIDLGFYLGIGGVLTYKNGDINRFIHELPLDKIVLETDAPYLAPVPYRGKRNSSEYLGAIAAELAQLRGISYSEVAHQTTKNAFELFGLPPDLA